MNSPSCQNNALHRQREVHVTFFLRFIIDMVIPLIIWSSILYDHVILTLSLYRVFGKLTQAFLVENEA